MTTTNTRTLALDLMGKHLRSDWTFAWTTVKFQYAACNYSTKQIKINKRYAQVSSEYFVRDAILHEIAHAMTEGAGHGWVWTIACRQIGAIPNATISSKENPAITLMYSPAK